jgi:hypothetical protein
MPTKAARNMVTESDTIVLFSEITAGWWTPPELKYGSAARSSGVMSSSRIARASNAFAHKRHGSPGASICVLPVTAVTCPFVALIEVPTSKAGMRY